MVNFAVLSIWDSDCLSITLFNDWARGCVASYPLQVSANKPSYGIGASTQLSLAANITSNGSGALNVSKKGLSAQINGACVPDNTRACAH